MLKSYFSTYKILKKETHTQTPKQKNKEKSNNNKTKLSSTKSIQVYPMHAYQRLQFRSCYNFLAVDMKALQKFLVIISIS